MASLGIDFGDNLGQGMGPDMAPVGGRKALLECGLRRFTVDEGSWPVDRTLGYNIKQLVLENIQEVESIRQRAEAEWMKDERVTAANVFVRWRPETRELFLEHRIEDATGPFRFVLRVTDVTVDVLSDIIDTTLGVS